MKLNLGNDLYLKGRIGWRGLSKDEYLAHSDYKIINATALMDGYVDWDKCGYISQERYEESDEIMLQENDLLISKDGTLGKIGYVKGLTTKCTVASGIFVLRNTMPDKLNFDYLYHVLKSHIFKNFIEKNKATGSTILHLYQRDLVNFELDIPSIDIQNSIANILNNIDDKIRCGKHANEVLEKMAKQLYDYWFVQFDFPDDNGKPYKSSGGKMVFNETLKREIPEGWSYDSIDNFCEVIDCLHSKKPEMVFEDENSYMLTLENLTSDGNISIQNKYYISKTDYQIWTSRIEVKENDFVVTNAGRAGDICKIPYYVKCAIGRNITAISPKHISPYYLKYFLKSIYVQQQIANNLDCGSFFMSFNVRSIKVMNILKPASNIHNKAHEIIKPMVIEIERNNEEIASLTSLRDFLLPMLMNGQVTIKDE